MADEQRKVEFTIDASKAKKELGELRKAQEQLAESAGKTDKSFDNVASSMGDYRNVVKQSIGDIAKQKRTVSDNTEEFGKQKRVLEDLEQQLNAIDEQYSKTSQLVGQAGDVGSAGRTIGGAIGAFGGDAGGKIESAISALSELPDTLEAIPRLQDSFKALPKIAALTADKLGLGGVAGSMQTLIPGLSAGTAGTLALAGAALAIAAPIAAVVLAMKQYNDAAEAQKKVLTATIDANKNLREDIASGLTSDEAQQKLEELKRQRDSEQQGLSRLETAYSSMEKQLGVAAGVVKLFDSREQALADSIDSGRASVADYDAQIKALEGALNSGTLASNDAAVSEEELADARKKAATEIDQQIKQSEGRASQALARSEQIGSQIDSAYAQRADAQATAAENEALEAKFAAEDQLKQEQEYRDNLAKIANEGRDRILELESGFAKLANDRAKDLAKVDTKGNEKLGDLRKDYFKSQISEVNDFNRETQKLTSDSAKRIKKINDDLLASLNDAQRDNNVIAFLEAQRRGNEQLAEEASNAKDAEQERLQDFLQRQQEERQAYQEKQAAIMADIQSEKQAVIDSYNEKRAALAQQIEDEKAAIEERKAAEAKRYQEQEAREAEQAARQAERDKLKQEQDDKAFQKRIADLRKQQAEEDAKYQQELSNEQQLASLKQQTYSAELAALQQIEAQARQIAQSASSGVGGTSRSTFGSRSSSGGSRFGYGGQSFGTSASTTNSKFGYGGKSFGGGGAALDSVRPFHGGGKVDFPASRTEGFVFAKKGELIVDNKDVGFPASGSQDRGLPLSLAQNNQANSKSPININYSPQISAQVGDIATKSQVSQALNESNELHMSELLKMIEGATG